MSILLENTLSHLNSINLILKQPDRHHPKFDYCNGHDFAKILEIHTMEMVYHLLLNIIIKSLLDSHVTQRCDENLTCLLVSKF